MRQGGGGGCLPVATPPAHTAPDTPWLPIQVRRVSPWQMRSRHSPNGCRCGANKVGATAPLTELDKDPGCPQGAGSRQCWGCTCVHVRV